MKASPGSDIAKIVLYLLSTLLLAALLSPALYHLGKGFAQAVMNKEMNAALGWLGEKAGRHGFETYFKRALMISALLLFIPLLLSLRLGSGKTRLTNSPLADHLPSERRLGQALRRPPLAPLHLLIGFILAAGLLSAMGWYLLSVDWFYLRDPLSWEKALRKAATPAIAASLIEEFVFRGALLGIFLRAFRPFWAILFLSILFATVHFLQPPEGAELANPDSWNAGFEMLSLVGQKFLAPLPLLHTFATLLLVGLILGHARYLTASLWLPIGLHAGWIFAFKAYNQLTFRRNDLPAEIQTYIGADLREGLLPLGTLLLTWLLVLLLVRLLPKRR